MIELIGADFSIKIQENNPAYKTLSRFAGENVLIQAQGIESEEVRVEEKIPKVFESVDREVVFADFFNAFPWSTLDEKEQPLTFSLLKNHLTQVLGSDKGTKSLEKTSDNVYKSGDLYLVLNN